jgi:DNA invertase Pin-like site-specific DNA recombinase
MRPSGTHGTTPRTPASTATCVLRTSRCRRGWCTQNSSAKRADRPELAKAIAQARRAGATLVVAKLDRLARNVAFTSELMESGVDFVACDNPHANRLTIHILAAVAEDAAPRISEWTKAALADAKRRGVKLALDCRVCLFAKP